MASNDTPRRTFVAIPPNYMGSDYLVGDWFAHPELAAALAEGDPEVRQLADVHKGLREGHATIVAELRKDVRTKTPEGHFLHTYKRAKKWQDEGVTRCGAARSIANNRIERLNADIAEAMQCADDRYTDKLRDRLYGMSAADLVRKAIDANDKAVMAAVFNGPAILCGLDDGERETLRTVATEKFAAEPLAKKRRIERALAVVDQAFSGAIVAVGTLFPKARIAELESEMAEPA